MRHFLVVLKQVWYMTALFLFCYPLYFLYTIRQVQSILYIVVLQALTQKLADSPFSVCALGEDALSWRGEGK